MAHLLARSRSFWLEMRRRNVFRVALSYGVVAWLVMQVAELVLPALGLPAWSVTLVVVLALLGFPMALALAWAFELTPDGVRREPAPAAHPAPPFPVTAASVHPGPPPPAGGGGVIPLPATPLVGRDRELAEAARLLRDRSVRMVTLVGVGGVGKTRLAVEVARTMRPEFEHGVCFVALGDLASTEPLAPVLAQHLDLPLDGALDPAAQVASFLRARRLLLVLDNFEHLAAQAVVLSEMVGSADGVRVLCTSRERLNLLAEVLVPLEGLPCPDGPTANAAAELFLQVARRVCPDFAPEPADEQAILRICRFVGGIPLAIELAAAWVGTLSCVEIADELEAEHDLLYGSLRDAPARHRSLRAVFDWSWRLLDEPERRAFRRLAVFRGFDRAAAEVVTGTTLPVLSALLGKSLVVRRVEGRFEIIGILRQFAAERLADDPLEARLVEEAHGRHFAALLARAAALPGAHSDHDLITSVGGEIENVRVAWRWMVREQRAGEIGDACHGLFCFFNLRGWAREGEQAFAAARERIARGGGAGRDELLAARLATRQAVFLQQLGRYERARKLLEDALPIFRQAVEPAETGLALDRLGLIASLGGEYQEARALLEEGLRIHRELHEPRGTARSLLNLGTVAYGSGDYADARRLFQESLSLARQAGDRRGTAMALKNLGGVAFVESAYPEAEQLLMESLAVDRELANRQGIANALQNLGCLAFRTGDSGRAEAYLREGAAISRAMGFRRLEAGCLNELGNVAQAEDRSAEAWEHYRSGLRAATEIRELPMALEILLGIARLMSREGEATRAAEILSLIVHEPASGKRTREQAEVLLEELGVAPAAGGADAPQLRRTLATLLEGDPLPGPRS